MAKLLKWLNWSVINSKRKLREIKLQPQIRYCVLTGTVWQRGVVVTELVVSTKLLYVEPG